MSDPNPQPEVEVEPSPVVVQLQLEVESLEERLNNGKYRNLQEKQDLEFGILARRTAIELHNSLTAQPPEE